MGCKQTRPARRKSTDEFPRIDSVVRYDIFVRVAWGSVRRAVKVLTEAGESRTFAGIYGASRKCAFRCCVKGIKFCGAAGFLAMTCVNKCGDWAI